MTRAIRLYDHGGPEVLRIEQLPDPHPEDGQVRVAVRAAGLNPFDSKVRRGTIDLPLPRGQGAEFAGVVDEIGPGVTGLAPGDEVLGWVGSGAQAEVIVVKAASVTPKPSELDWALAGALGLVSNTAGRSLGPLAVGSTDVLLITGVSGAVGLVAAQLALRTGCRVIGTARAEHHPFLADLGIEAVAYGAGEAERLRGVAGDAFTAALDTVGTAGLDTAQALGIPMSRVNSIAAGDDATARGAGTVGGGGKTAAELAWFAAEYAAGRLVLPVRATYGFDRVRDAYTELDTGHGIGKVVLLMP